VSESVRSCRGDGDQARGNRRWRAPSVGLYEAAGRVKSSCRSSRFGFVSLQLNHGAVPRVSRGSVSPGSALAHVRTIRRSEPRGRATSRSGGGPRTCIGGPGTRGRSRDAGIGASLRAGRPRRPRSVARGRNHSGSARSRCCTSADEHLRTCLTTPGFPEMCLLSAFS